MASSAKKREIIGRRTWINKAAYEVIHGEEHLERKLPNLRTKSGLGASGIPHIGSLGDAVRANGIKLAIEDQGRESEMIAFSDDMDGLRKVPSGLPDTLEKYIGIPVSRIPDPFHCHDSYGTTSSVLVPTPDIVVFKKICVL